MHDLSHIQPDTLQLGERPQRSSRQVTQPGMRQGETLFRFHDLGD